VILNLLRLILILFSMNKLIRKIFFRNTPIKTFFISRLTADEVLEQVFLKQGSLQIEITKSHGMICLDPFCVAVWLSAGELKTITPEAIQITFTKQGKLNAMINVSLIEQVFTEKGALLLYRIKKSANYQLNPLHRLLFYAYLVRSPKNTYYSRKVIGALYSYPRSIIIVSYQDNNYCNIFPMDIHGYIEKEDLYILGLRTTNITLNKIVEAGKVVVCDTNAVDINTVYTLGKHSSSAPTPLADMPFKTMESEQFRFPVPEFVGGYKELEIIHHKKMGFHMLLVGKVVNKKQLVDKPSSLYHIGFMEFQTGDYKNIEGVY
jgi:hypothetical protein